MSRNRIYVGGLDSKIEKEDVEDAFEKFGKINSVDMKHDRVHERFFAFVEFDDEKDAEDAVEEMNRGKIGSSENIIVEPSKQKRETRGAPGDRGRGGYGDRGGERRGPARGRYRLRIENLPDRVTWQDLKDFARGPRNRWACVFADVDDRRHVGWVEYDYYDDMDDAYRMLHKEIWMGEEIYTYKLDDRDRSPSPPPRGGRGGSRYDDSPPPRSSYPDSPPRKARPDSP